MYSDRERNFAFFFFLILLEHLFSIRWKSSNHKETIYQIVFNVKRNVASEMVLKKKKQIVKFPRHNHANGLFCVSNDTKTTTNYQYDCMIFTDVVNSFSSLHFFLFSDFILSRNMKRMFWLHYINSQKNKIMEDGGWLVCRIWISLNLYSPLLRWLWS